MISPTTIKNYAAAFQIDGFTVLREYLQIVFLNTFFQQAESKNIFFKGGTALRLVYGSPRFSEDLDFTSQLGKLQLQKTISKAIQKTGETVPGVSSKEIKSIRGFSNKIFLETDLAPMPLTIKLDFSGRETALDAKQTVISTKLPVQNFALVNVLSAEEILAEKIRTIFQRQKGRDVYDLWFLLNKQVPLKKELVNQKMRLINQKYDQEKLIKKLASFDKNSLKNDLNKFLPNDQRSIINSLPKLISAQLSRPTFLRNR